jgi:hypothetical protein
MRPWESVPTASSKAGAAGRGGRISLRAPGEVRIGTRAEVGFSARQADSSRCGFAASAMGAATAHRQRRRGRRRAADSSPARPARRGPSQPRALQRSSAPLRHAATPPSVASAKGSGRPGRGDRQGQGRRTPPSGPDADAGAARPRVNVAVCRTRPSFDVAAACHEDRRRGVKESLATSIDCRASRAAGPPIFHKSLCKAPSGASSDSSAASSAANSFESRRRPPRISGCENRASARSAPSARLARVIFFGTTSEARRAAEGGAALPLLLTVWTLCQRRCRRSLRRLARGGLLQDLGGRRSSSRTRDLAVGLAAGTLAL